MHTKDALRPWLGACLKGQNLRILGTLNNSPLSWNLVNIFCTFRLSVILE